MIARLFTDVVASRFILRKHWIGEKTCVRIYMHIYIYIYIYIIMRWEYVYEWNRKGEKKVILDYKMK